MMPVCPMNREHAFQFQSDVRPPPATDAEYFYSAVTLIVYVTGV